MNQKGYTLLELLVTVAISGVILTGVVMSISQIASGTVRSGSDMSTLTDVNFAVLIMKKDIIMAQTTDLNATPKSSATLDWVDYSSFQSEDWPHHTISYSLSGANLMRTYDGVTSIAGRNITSVSFSQVDRVISVVISATSSGAEQNTEILRFSAYIRAEEQQ